MSFLSPESGNNTDDDLVTIGSGDGNESSNAFLLQDVNSPHHSETANTPRPSSPSWLDNEIFSSSPPPPPGTATTPPYIDRLRNWAQKQTSRLRTPRSSSSIKPAAVVTRSNTNRTTTSSPGNSIATTPENNNCPVTLPERWNKFTYTHRKYILLLTFVLLWPLGLYSLPHFTKGTDSTFHPIAGSPSAEAVTLFREAYGNKDGSLGLDDPLNPGAYVVLEQKTKKYDGEEVMEEDSDGGTLVDGTSEIYKKAKQFAENMEGYLIKNLPRGESSEKTKPEEEEEEVTTQDRRRILQDFENDNEEKEEDEEEDGDDDLPMSERIALETAKATMALGFEERFLTKQPTTSRSSPSEDKEEDGTSGQSKAPSQDKENQQEVTDNSNIPQIQVMSYYSLLDQKLPHLARTLATPDGRTTILQIKYTIPSQIELDPQMKRLYWTSILDSVRQYGDEIQANNTDQEDDTMFTVSYTGLKYFQSDLIESTKLDLKRMDLYVLPLALIILAFVLQAHFTVILIPIFTILTTIFAWSILMLGLCQVMQITQFTPSVMMSLTIGMGIDYTLFLLSRYLSDARTMGNKYDAVGSMINSAGHTILVSGITLQCTFLGLTLLPLQMLRSVGVGSAVAIGTALMVNLLIVPSILHTTFGEFILRETDCKPSKKCFGKMMDSIRRCSYGVTNLCRNGCRIAPSGISSNNEEEEDGGGSSLRNLYQRSRSRSRQRNSRQGLLTGEGGGGVDQENVIRYTSFDEMLSRAPTPRTSTTRPSAHHRPIPSREVTESLLADMTSPLLTSEQSRTATASTKRGRRSRSLKIDTSVQTNPSEEQPKHPSGIPLNSPWYKLCTHLLHPIHGTTILLLILLLLLPVSLYTTQLHSSLSFDLILPSKSPSMITFQELSTKFGEGTMSPYRILFDGRLVEKRVDTVEGFQVMHKVLTSLEGLDKELLTPENENVDEDDESQHSEVNLDSIPLRLEMAGGDLFESLGEVVDEVFGNLTEMPTATERRQLTDLDEEDDPLCAGDDSVSLHKRALSKKNNNSTGGRTTTTTYYNGISVVRNIPIPHPLYVGSKLCSQLHPYCPIELLHLFDYVDDIVTSKDRMTTYLSATLPVNPFSDEGVHWLLSARTKIKELEKSDCLLGYRVLIDGGASVEYDAVKEVYDAFPTMIGLTLGVVFILMGIFFRSIITPLRSVISICMTLSFVYGLSVLVYQHGILNWTGIHSWNSGLDGEISWLAPVMAFSIIVGLGLDYDVFLISRILEYRLVNKYSHKQSIAAGLHATGGIITAAGIIMSVAFGGLMLSTSPALYQWSFLLTSAVLLDTFVIRTLVVPILLGYTGKWSWWPRAMPEEEEERQLDYNAGRTIGDDEETMEEAAVPLVPRSP